MAGIDKSKRTKESRRDRFYVGDIIKNKITNKVLKVAIVTLGADGNGILFYSLCDVDEKDESLLNRYIPVEAFSNWEVIN